jgi:hypothetical protein
VFLGCDFYHRVSQWYEDVCFCVGLKLVLPLVEAFRAGGPSLGAPAVLFMSSMPVLTFRTGNVAGLRVAFPFGLPSKI